MFQLFVCVATDMESNFLGKFNKTHCEVYNYSQISFDYTELELILPVVVGAVVLIVDERVDEVVETSKFVICRKTLCFKV